LQHITHTNEWVRSITHRIKNLTQTNQVEQDIEGLKDIFIFAPSPATTKKQLYFTKASSYEIDEQQRHGAACREQTHGATNTTYPLAGCLMIKRKEVPK